MNNLDFINEQIEIKKDRIKDAEKNLSIQIDEYNTMLSIKKEIMQTKK